MAEWGVLGDVLAREPSAANQVHVANLVDHAAALLSRVPETFPTYTLHDAGHAANVVRLMGELARPNLTAIDPLEAALLILAAYWHDIGMVYTEDELAAIPASRNFQDFLAARPEEFLATSDNDGQPPQWVVVAYCRHRHADRVRDHLRKIDPAWLRWDGVSFAEELELICRSHNQPAGALYQEPFRTDFLFKADVRACAVLLRLADILDLDDSRTPLGIYAHLSLARRATDDTAVSDDEWRKHLCSQGFHFPPTRVPNYRLQFAARPESPGVEHDLRSFLQTVEEELQLSRGVRDVCSGRWRDLPLPGSIDTSLIRSRGYRYGEFRFELDRESVLDLFTGEQLYGEPKAFLRELLQNAIDAVRLRAHLHRDAFAHPPRVDVTCWEDADRAIRVRVDDNGIGMDEAAIRAYFLRVGRSYYRSATFRADLVRHGQAGRSFGVISRFGIGILSCFMAGDEIDVSTRQIRADGTSAPAVRLSLTRDQDYFVLQEEGDDAAAMPSSAGPGDPFRAESGTSVAVRIDPNRTGIDVAAAVEAARAYVLRAPVIVTVNGQQLGQYDEDAVEQIYAAAPFTVDVPLPGRGVTPDGFPYLGPLSLRVLPLDLGGHPDTPEVSGHLTAIVAGETDGDTTDPDPFVGWPEADPAVTAARAAVAEAAYRRTMAVAEFKGFDCFTVHAWTRCHPAAVEEALESIEWSGEWSGRVVMGGDWAGDAATRAQHLVQSSENFGAVLKSMSAGRESILMSASVDSRRSGVKPPDSPAMPKTAPTPFAWSYNGILLPLKTTVDVLSDIRFGSNERVKLLGTVVLADQLRPDLTISRDRVRAVPIEVHSALQLALYHAAARLPREGWSTVIDHLSGVGLINVPPAEQLSLRRVGQDPLIADGAWTGARVIETATGMATVAEIRAEASAGVTVTLPHPTTLDVWHLFGPLFNFTTLLRLTLIQQYLQVEWAPDPAAGSGTLQVSCGDLPVVNPGAELFPPLYAVAYADDDTVAFNGTPPDEEEFFRTVGFLNRNHALARWLFANADTLATDFAASFQRVFFKGPLVWRDPAAVNDALDAVARARPAIAPPPEAYLRVRDDGRWVSR